MRAKRLWMLIALLATPVWAMKVTVEHEPGVDFSRYSTYEFHPQPERPADHPLAPGSPLGARIMAAVERQLAARGFRKVEGDRPDFRVLYYGVLQDHLDIEGVHYQLGDHVEFMGPVDQASRSYSQGILVLHVRDAGSDEVVWKGWATDVARTPEKLREKVEKAVKKILNQFPPK